MEQPTAMINILSKCLPQSMINLLSKSLPESMSLAPV